MLSLVGYQVPHPPGAVFHQHGFIPHARKCLPLGVYRFRYGDHCRLVVGCLADTEVQLAIASGIIRAFTASTWL